MRHGAQVPPEEDCPCPAQPRATPVSTVDRASNVNPPSETPQAARGRRASHATPRAHKGTDPQGTLFVQPDLPVEDLELGLVDVVLHPGLRDLVERRAGNRVPVELVGRELLELPRDGLALRWIYFARVASVVLVDFGV